MSPCKVNGTTLDSIKSNIIGAKLEELHCVWLNTMEVGRMRNVLVGLVALFVVGCTPALDSYNERLEKQRELAKEAREHLEKLTEHYQQVRRIEDLFAGRLSAEETARAREQFEAVQRAIDTLIEATDRGISRREESLAQAWKDFEKANRELADAAMAGIPSAQATIRAQAEASQRIREANEAIEQAQKRFEELLARRTETAKQIAGAEIAEIKASVRYW